MQFFTSRQVDLEDERRRKAGTLKNGERVSFDLLMRDGSSSSTFLTDSVTLTDAERNLAVQRAMNVHLSHQRYSSNPLPFTDAQAADAIQKARRSISSIRSSAVFWLNRSHTGKLPTQREQKPCWLRSRRLSRKRYGRASNRHFSSISRTCGTRRRTCRWNWKASGSMCLALSTIASPTPSLISVPSAMLAVRRLPR